MQYWNQSAKNIYVAAHRGFSSAYPENTMEAFRAALALGVDQIETDVRVTKDGALVLIHDAKVDRTTNSEGEVKNFTLEELRKLDAGSWKNESFRGAKIPTLRELLELVKDHPSITLDLELKEYPTEGWEEVSYDVCDRVIAMVEEYGFGDRIVLNTFSGKLHDYIREKYGDRYKQHVFYPKRHLGTCKIDPYSYAYCCCMFGTDSRMATPEECEAMRACGVRTWMGAAVKDEATVDAAIACGAELITCNNAGTVLNLLKQKGYHL